MLKVLKDLLEAKSINEEVASKIDVEVSTIIKEVRDESASYRVKYKELQKTFEEVNNSKAELEKQVTGLDEKIQKAKTEGKAELVKELEAEKTQKAELMEKLSTLESTTKTLKVENALGKALSKYDVIDTDLLNDTFKHKLNVFNDEVRFSEDKNLEDGLKEFFEAKPHLLKPKGNGGSGAEGGNSGANLDFKKMSLDEKSELYRKDPELYKKLKGSN